MILKKLYFSIVIPAYNAEKFLKDALDSIKKQTYCKYEIIVVNNGSEDATLDIAEGFKKKNPGIDMSIISLMPNQGISRARNIGNEKAKYDYICYLDADDIWYPQKLERVNNTIEKFKDIDVLWHWENQLSENKRSLLRYKPVNNKDAFGDLLFNGNRVSTSAVTLKKERIISIGGFSAKFVQGEEDYDCWLRLAKVGAKFHLIEEVLGEYRLWGGNWSAKSEIHNRAVLDLEKYHFKNLSEENIYSKRLLKKKYRIILARYYYINGRNLSKNNQKVNAWKNFLKSLRYCPYAWKTYVAILLVVISK